MKLGVALPVLSDSRHKYVELTNHLACACRHRFEGVELHIDDPGKVLSNKLERLVGDAGLELISIGTGMTYTRFGLSFLDDRVYVRRAAERRAVKYIEMASSLDCSVIIALIRGRYSIRMGKERALLILSETLKRLDRIAERRSVQLLLEPVNRYETNTIHTLSDAANMIERCKAAATKILVDTYHMNIEEESPARSIRSFNHLLGHVHVADCNRGAPSRGHIDFRGILSMLKSVDYRGWVSAEIMFRPDEESALGQTFSAINPLL